MQKITPFLWFNDNAEEALDFYASVFKNSKIISKQKWPENSPNKVGTIMTGIINIEGQDLILLNGGPTFKLTEAVSFVVDCENQEEVDELWSKLTADGGEESQCGWLKDKFGLSWQIVPKQLSVLMSDPDPAKASRVMQAMLKMKKIHVAGLQAAYDEE